MLNTNGNYDLSKICRLFAIRSFLTGIKAIAKIDIKIERRRIKQCHFLCGITGVRQLYSTENLLFRGVLLLKSGFIRKKFVNT